MGFTHDKRDADAMIRFMKPVITTRRHAGPLGSDDRQSSSSELGPLMKSAIMKCLDGNSK